MPERQGRDELGFNFQIGKGDSFEIQKNFYVVIPIESAVNRAVFGDFAIRRDEKLPRYSGLELRSRLCELALRHNPVVIFVEFDKLCRVLDRKSQYYLQAVRALSYREAA